MWNKIKCNTEVYVIFSFVYGILSVDLQLSHKRRPAAAISLVTASLFSGLSFGRVQSYTPSASP